LVSAREHYRPYGDKLISPNTNESAGFANKAFDASTNLSYMSARYYNPTLGRFISPDPVHFVEDNVHSFNRYAYANNNPMKFVDPDGKQGVLVAQLGPMSPRALGERVFSRTVDAVKQAPEVQVTIGVSASLSVENRGLSGGLGVGLTSRGAFIGQFAATDVTQGVGMFGGVGLQVGVSTSTGRTPIGLSVSPQISHEVNVGWGPSLGGTISTSPDSRGAQGPAPRGGRFGAGFGAAVTKGNTTQSTISSPSLGSKDSEDSKDGTTK
jgi:RHS repeat-associated protein